ncbi:MAG TPA: FAD-binding oxidoreductase [Acetobacteraceae bacterium]|nr:FAD-binding oxidoreductase [Acetobacteraceae bacterium]
MHRLAPRLAADFKLTPHWWDAAPRPMVAPPPLPPRVDVAIVGSGITGLVAALHLARGGRHVAVLERDALGIGASSRNAGFVGRTFKHSFGKLLRKRGPAFAATVYREMQAAFDSVAEMVRNEHIDCHFRICGRFITAVSPAQYESIAAELDLRRRHLGDAFEMVPRARQHAEIGSDAYHGGAIVPDLGSLHPGLYHQGLLDRARDAGAELHPETPVIRIAPSSVGFAVTTGRGSVQARDVLVATNGYTGAATPWLARRVVPFDAFMVATEALPPHLLDRALPTGRTCLDDNHNIDFMRRSPDGNRILFGGRTGNGETDPLVMAGVLQTRLDRLLPDLASVALARAWTGRCAGTFDLWPHLGSRSGITYAMGYCFAGVPMGTYLGIKAARRILGVADAGTVFADRRFPTVPLYTGNPWFVPWVMGFWDWRDSRQNRIKEMQDLRV